MSQGKRRWVFGGAIGVALLLVATAFLVGNIVHNLNGLLVTVTQSNGTMTVIARGTPPSTIVVTHGGDHVPGSPDDGSTETNPENTLMFSTAGMGGNVLVEVEDKLGNTYSATIEIE